MLSNHTGGSLEPDNGVQAAYIINTKEVGCVMCWTCKNSFRLQKGITGIQVITGKSN